MLPYRALARGARVLCYGHLLSSLIEPAKVGATLGTGQRGVATDVARVVFTVGAAVTWALHWVLTGHPGALHCPTVHLTKLGDESKKICVPMRYNVYGSA